MEIHVLGHIYANNKGADQPAHPRSLISAFVVRRLDSIIPMLVRGGSRIFEPGVQICQGGFELTISPTFSLNSPRKWNNLDSKGGSVEPPPRIPSGSATACYIQDCIWIDRFVSYLVATLRRHVFAWRDSFDKQYSSAVLRFTCQIITKLY